MAESKFQSNLIKELKTRFPGSLIMKNDAGYIQGIPDLIILHGKKWAGLECKKNKGASQQPNQEYYIDKMNKMSFAAFISPENREELLNELQRALRP